MPRVAVQDNSRISLRIRSQDKALLMRAVAYTHTDLTAFVVQNAVQAAKAVLAEAEQVALSERDSLRVLSALEDPPAPNARLLAAAQGLPALPHLHLAGGSAQAQV
jgi:uncharacterized protein (DUF1778 family)